MARKMKPGDNPDTAPGVGDNSYPKDEEINDAIEEIISLKSDRTGHTSQAAAVTKKINKAKAAIVGKGMPTRSFNRLLEDVETERTEGGRDKRREIDDAHSKGREAMGLPGQLALFDQIDQAAPTAGNGADAGAPA